MYTVSGPYAQHLVPTCGKIDDCDWLRTDRRPLDPLVSKSHHPFLLSGPFSTCADHAVVSARNPVANWNSWARFYRSRFNELQADETQHLAAQHFLAFVEAWAHHHWFWHTIAAMDCKPVTVFRYEDLLLNTTEVRACLRPCVLVCWFDTPQ